MLQVAVALLILIVPAAASAAWLPSYGVKLRGTANISFDRTGFYRSGERIDLRFDLRPEDLRASTATQPPGWSFIHDRNEIPLQVVGAESGVHPRMGVIGRLLAVTGRSTPDQIRVDVQVGNQVVPVLQVFRTLPPEDFPLSVDEMLTAIRQSVVFDHRFTPVHGEGMLIVGRPIPGPAADVIQFNNAEWTVVPEPVGLGSVVAVGMLWLRRRR